MTGAVGNRKLRTAMMAVLFLAPLLFGAVEEWSIALVESAAVILLALYVRLRIQRGGHFYRVPGLWPLGLLGALILLQILPMPQWLLLLVSPKSGQFYQETLGRLDSGFWAPISLNPRATVLEFIRLFAYASFYVLLVQVLSKAGRLKKTVRSLAVFAGAIAFISIINHYAGNGLVMWVRKPPGGEFSGFGPYVSRNHFAGLMVMLCPFLAAIFFISRLRVHAVSFGGQLAEAVSDRSINRHMLYGVAAGFACVSVFVSLSRGGIVALSVSLVLLGALLLRREPGKAALMGLGAAGVVASVGWFGWEPIIARFWGDTLKDTLSVTGRFSIWSDTVRMIKDFPLFGAGFGAYGSIYPAYRTLSGRAIVDHAHSDPLELLAEGGLVGLGLGLWFVCSVFASAFTVSSARKNPYSYHLTAGSLAGAFAFLIHGLVDFNLHIGANGLMFFFMLGLAVSAAHTRMRESHGRTLLAKARVAPTRRLFIASALAAGVVTAANALVLSAMALSAPAMRFDPAASSSENLKALRWRFGAATILDPLNAGNWFAQANAAVILDGVDRALPLYERAVRFSPLDARYLAGAARAVSRKGGQEAASGLMESALSYGDRRFDPALVYAAWLLELERFDDAVRVARAGMLREPSEASRYFDMMRKMGITEAELMATVPEDAMYHVLLGAYLDAKGFGHIAEDPMRRAFDLLDPSRPVPQSELYLLSAYFTSTGRGGHGLEVMRTGVEMHPQDPSLRSTLAVAYEREGYPYQARRQYERVLMLRPGDQNAEARVRALSGFAGPR